MIQRLFYEKIHRGETDWSHIIILHANIKFVTWALIYFFSRIRYSDPRK
jgi:hypothetical protein